MEAYFKCSYTAPKAEYFAVGWFNQVREADSFKTVGPYDYYVFKSKCKWEQHTYFKPDYKRFTRSGNAAFVNRGGLFNEVIKIPISGKIKRIVNNTIKKMNSGFLNLPNCRVLGREVLPETVSKCDFFKIT